MQLLKPGTWRITVAGGYGPFATSHLAICPEVAPQECRLAPIPDHRHVVRLSLYHADLTVGYGLSPRVLLLARLPYDVKDQRVRYTTLDGRAFLPPYGDIHHRTETLHGFSDAELMVLYALVPGWRVGAGLTLPIGHTEPDPIALGLLGLEHEHLQFGSGTVDPRVFGDASHRFGRVTLEALADARVPLYANSRGYHAPATLHWKVGPLMSFGTTGVTAALAGQVQTIAHWHGKADEGTGFVNGGLFLGVSQGVGRGFRIAPGLYRELFSHSLSHETFEQGTTWSLAVSRTFR